MDIEAANGLCLGPSQRPKKVVGCKKVASAHENNISVVLT